MLVPKSAVLSLVLLLLGSFGLNLWLLTRESTPAELSAAPRILKPSPARESVPATGFEPAALDAALAAKTDADALVALFADRARVAPEAALQWAETRTEGTLHGRLVETGLSIWAATAPQAAAEWVSFMAPGAGRDQALLAVLAAWGSNDAPAAAGWLDQLAAGPLNPPEESLLAGAGRLVEVWADRDPAGAVAWALDFAERHEGSDALHLGLIAWGRDDPVAAQTFFQSLPDDAAVRVEAAQSIARGMVRSHPADAWNWAIRLGPGEAGWQARNTVIEHWSGERPSQVASRIGTLADAEERAGHIETLVARWTETNADAAEVWTLRLPPGGDRDHALKALAENHGSGSPVRALELSLEIRGAELRAEVAAGLLASWREQDRARADAWFVAAPLDPELKRVLAAHAFPVMDEASLE